MTLYQAIFSAPEPGGVSDPEWLPAPEEVARARRNLERRGVSRSLHPEAIDDDRVPPGEPPRAWLGVAAAWVLIWPAVIALRLGQGWWPWMPWWLPVVVAILHMMVLVIPVLRSQQRTGPHAVRRRFAQVQNLAQMMALEPEELETWVGLLFTLRGYEVRNTRFSADHGIDLEVAGEGIARGVVQCKRYRGTVGEPVVRELYGTHVHENAEYSWLATTGAISRRAREWAAGKPMDLWDGQRLVELARKYR